VGGIPGHWQGRARGVLQTVCFVSFDMVRRAEIERREEFVRASCCLVFRRVVKKKKKKENLGWVNPHVRVRSAVVVVCTRVRGLCGCGACAMPLPLLKRCRLAGDPGKRNCDCELRANNPLPRLDKYIYIIVYIIIRIRQRADPP